MINSSVNDKDLERQVQGLVKALLALPKDLAKKRMRSAINKATKPFEPVLRSNTPYRTGSLMRSIKSKVKVYDHGTYGAGCFVAGYVRGTLKKRRGQFMVSGSGEHAIIVERGTKARYTKSGKPCGVMPPRRMAEQTLASTKTQILSAMASELAAGLEKTAAEYAK
jgi:HK97 gp10 family phage protein